MSVLERKAEKTLSVLRQVSVTEKLSTKSLLQLYKALVIPKMEFAASVWQNSSSADTLNKIQRKGLAFCLGVPATSALNAVEVKAGALPLELRREELSIREGGKIMSKDNSQPIKELWNEWRDSYRGNERYLSPFGLIDLQLQDMETNSGTNVISIEPEFTFLEGLYLRNLLTHTVNNLLQTLNNVKSIQFFVVKQKFNIIHIMCENFKTIPWVLCKIQLIFFERHKIGSHKNWNLGPSLHFSDFNFICHA